jgi:hypothetical protein
MYAHMMRMEDQRNRLIKSRALEATIAVWNDFDSKFRSFADEYSSL